MATKYDVPKETVLAHLKGMPNGGLKDAMVADYIKVYGELPSLDGGAKKRVLKKKPAANKAAAKKPAAKKPAAKKAPAKKKTATKKK